jgi:nucleotide-binding universal stress UspA family protein
LLRAAEAHTFPGGDPVEAEINVVREAEEYLAEIAKRLGTSNGTPMTTSVWYGPPASAIIEAAHFTHADLIVMTTHGRSGLGRLFLGSVAESVIRGTSTPILVVHPEGAPLEAPKGSSVPAAAKTGSVTGGCASGWMSAGKTQP